MAHAFGHLIRGGVGCAFPCALEPVGDNRFHLRAIVVFVVFALAAGAFGQPAGPSVRFTVFSAKPIEGLTFAPVPGAAPQKVQFYPTARSPHYEYRGAMPVRFLDATSGAVVAEATIPPGTPDSLLLFTPTEAAGDAAKTKLRYQISVLDDGAARHAPGGLAIINLSGLGLSGTVNKEKITLKAGLNPTLTVGSSAAIAFGTTVKNRVYQAYAGTLKLGRSERALLILFPPFYQGTHEVQSRLLVDQPPGTAVAKPPAPKR